MKIDAKAVGRELRALRVKSDLDTAYICKKVGITPKSLYTYENDASKMQYKVLEKLLEVYKITPDIFFNMISEYFHNIGE